MHPRRAPLILAACLLFLSSPGCNRAPGETGGRAGDAESKPAGPALFREITSEVGLDFTHHVTIGGEYALPEEMGAGVAVFDANGDGLLDLYFLDSGETRGKGAPDRLYLRTKEGRYRDATDGAGLDQTGYGTGVAAGDLDDDGDVDLYVGNWGRDEIFKNDGAARFTDVTAQSGISGDHWTASVALVDYDLDGFLDVYVSHYVKYDPARTCPRLDGRRDYCGPLTYPGDTDTLYHNRGDGTFEDVTRGSGIDSVARNGLGVFVSDFNDDGWPDIYVANDGQANNLWINHRNGKFADGALPMGVAVNGAGVAQASMGIALGDVDQDDGVDMFITNIVSESNILYRRVDSFGFRDDTALAQLADPSRAHTGFGAVLFDADHDGDLDLAIANGRVERGPLVPGAAVDAHWNDYADRNQLFLNDGRGIFAENGAGAFRERVEVGRALAAADLDGDGDLDLVVTNVSGPARIFENVGARGHWLAVRARDERLKRDVFGATIVVHSGGKSQRRIVGSAVSYFTSCVTPCHFGLASASQVEWIEVVWPGGTKERFSGTPVDREITLLRGGSGR